MASAARAGDMTSHGGSLSAMAGSVNVRIGGQAAWRAGVDVHVCSLSDGTKPHVGGVVAKGSLKVSINKFPAAREGDQIIESGAPNTIAKGFSKVQIGG